MTLSLKTVAASVVLGVSAFLTAAPASADSFVLKFGGGHGPEAGIIIDGSRHHRRNPEFFDDYRHERRHIRPVRQICTEDKALWKASQYGLHHVRVAFSNHDVIGVKGRVDGRRARIIFARAPGCPVINY